MNTYIITGPENTPVLAYLIKDDLFYVPSIDGLGHSGSSGVIDILPEELKGYLWYNEDSSGIRKISTDETWGDLGMDLLNVGDFIEGDQVVRKEKVKVLGKPELCIVRSSTYDPTMSSNYSFREISDSRPTLPNSLKEKIEALREALSRTKEEVELTMNEIAEKFNIPVSNLKIKKQ